MVDKWSGSCQLSYPSAFHWEEVVTGGDRNALPFTSQWSHVWCSSKKNWVTRMHWNRLATNLWDVCSTSTNPRMFSTPNWWDVCSTCTTRRMSSQQYNTIDLPQQLFPSLKDENVCLSWSHPPSVQSPAMPLEHDCRSLDHTALPFERSQSP